MAVETQLSIIRAAERLFAERGIDAVSLREINRESGQRNRSASRYHFGDKRGLLEAIVERHSLGVHAQWVAMLDLMETQGRSDLRAIVEVLVVPLVAKLDDADGGPEFIAVSAQLTGSRTYPLMSFRAAFAEGTLRMSKALADVTTVLPELMILRSHRVMGILYHSIWEYARLRESPALSNISRAVFTADLVDCVCALMRTEPSARTLDALGQSSE